MRFELSLTPRTFILPKCYLSVDRTPPVPSCPADIVREVPLSQTRTQVFFTAPTATDNSGVVPTITAQSHATTDFFDLGFTKLPGPFLMPVEIKILAPSMSILYKVSITEIMLI